MITYINEESLERHTDSVKTFRMLLKASKELEAAGLAVLKNGEYFCRGEFKRRFNEIPKELPPMEKALLRTLVFTENAHWKCWRSTRVSAVDVPYVCEVPEMVACDASICEATEKKLCDRSLSVGVLSAPDSQFSGRSRLRTKKQEDQTWVEIENGDAVEAIRVWITWEKGYFDPAANVAPRDYQTILEKAPNRFRRTGRRQRVNGKERRIYLEIETQRQFYVDEWHPGHSAHLEVFDSDGNHLGEADIVTGTLDFSKKDPRKRITL